MHGDLRSRCRRGQETRAEREIHARRQTVGPLALGGGGWIVNPARWAGLGKLLGLCPDDGDRVEPDVNVGPTTVYGGIGL